MFRKDFPLIINNPDILYLDNAATTQKPAAVIDGVSEFLKSEYANVHRGLYSLSEKSETHYEHSKELVSELLNCESKEVIYAANATASVNLIAQTLVNSYRLKKGDSVLIGIRDHHANILPRMSLSKLFGFNVKFFGINEDYTIDYSDFAKKYTDDVKVVSCGYVSNVTGAIYDVKKIKSLLRDDTFYIVDASQAVPNLLVDFQEIGCDALVFTAHKIMAFTGVGGLILKRDLLKQLQPLSVGGGTVKDVSIDEFKLKSGTGKFEPGTPDIIGAVSLEYALEYVKSLGKGDMKSGMKVIEEHEKSMAEYGIKKFEELKDNLLLVGPKVNRIPIFSFIINGHENYNQIGEYFAERGICIRCGGHCAYPLYKSLDIGGSCRMSTYIYNDKEDIDKFFNVLSELI